jgi:tryptophan-rich sensory protein
MTGLASTGQLRASFLRWALFLVPAVVLLGAVSGQAAGSGPGNAWFDALEKPSLYPPPATFGIVWTILYVLMGLAAAMVAAARGAPLRIAALVVFAVQLALNLAWSPLFFAKHQISGALALLVVIDIAVIVTIWLFYKVRPVAGLILLPYLAWVLFATVLNWQFLQANPNLDGQDVSGPAMRYEF